MNKPDRPPSTGEFNSRLTRTLLKHGALRCHYCRAVVYAPCTPEALQRPDYTATRDHTLPKCDGGRDWVVACQHCNALKGSDPYDLFVAFMKNDGQEQHVHERKKAYRWFRDQIIAIGLLTFDETKERLERERTSD